MLVIINALIVYYELAERYFKVKRRQNMPISVVTVFLIQP